jgi:hypothetical protein
VEVDGDELLGFERRGEKRRPAADDADLEDPTAVELVHVAEVSLDEPAWLPNEALVASGGPDRLDLNRSAETPCRRRPTGQGATPPSVVACA